LANDPRTCQGLRETARSLGDGIGDLRLKISTFSRYRRRLGRALEGTPYIRWLDVSVDAERTLARVSRADLSGRIADGLTLPADPE
jgi:hypothetical protein